MNKKLLQLMHWELEEIWRFPALELFVAIVVFFALNTPRSDITYTFSNFQLFIIQVILVAVFYARSVASCIEKREILVLLSNPIKRTSLFLSKFLTNLLIIFLICASVVVAGSYLMFLEPWDTKVFIGLLIVFINILFLSTLSFTSSLILKTTWGGTILPVIIYFGLAFGIPQSADFPRVIPPTGSNVIFDYLTRTAYSQYTFEEFIVALAFPIIASTILLLAAFLYFRRMEID
jgi:ABC-type transport system involved in multi-copper enzyme maturation permease subunit